MIKSVLIAKIFAIVLCYTGLSSYGMEKNPHPEDIKSSKFTSKVPLDSRIQMLILHYMESLEKKCKEKSKDIFFAFRYPTPEKQAMLWGGIHVDRTYEEIQKDLEQWGVLRLRNFQGEKRLVLACGNTPTLAATILDSKREEHAHVGAVTVDISPFMNPTILSPWGARVADYLLESTLLFQTAYIENAVWLHEEESLQALARILDPSFGMLTLGGIRFSFFPEKDGNTSGLTTVDLRAGVGKRLNTKDYEALEQELLAMPSSFLKKGHLLLGLTAWVLSPEQITCVTGALLQREVIESGKALTAALEKIDLIPIAPLELKKETYLAFNAKKQREDIIQYKNIAPSNSALKQEPCITITWEKGRQISFVPFAHIVLTKKSLKSL